jgi:hypothetical protein
VFEELTATRGLTMYLMSTQTEAEAQKDITAEKVQVISQQNVYLVVRDAIKASAVRQRGERAGLSPTFSARSCRAYGRGGQATQGVYLQGRV